MGAKMTTRVKVFKNSINHVEDEINDWAKHALVRIVSSSITYDEKSSLPGWVFVLVVYEAAE